MDRLWSGANDPDPVVVQIGAAIVDLNRNAEIIDEIDIYVEPLDRNGLSQPLDSYFTDLTGIDSDDIERRAVSLNVALTQLDQFSRGSNLWSWGKDELLAIAVSCFVQRVENSFEPTRFKNLKQVFLCAGCPENEINATSSGRLAGYIGVKTEGLVQHNALDDVRSLAYSLQKILHSGAVNPKHFE